jgi:hypothetical protein
LNRHRQNKRLPLLPSHNSRNSKTRKRNLKCLLNRFCRLRLLRRPLLEERTQRRFAEEG